MVSVITGASVSVVSTPRPLVAAAVPSVCPRRRVKGFRLRWAAGAGTRLQRNGWCTYGVYRTAFIGFHAYTSCGYARHGIGDEGLRLGLAKYSLYQKSHIQISTMFHFTMQYAHLVYLMLIGCVVPVEFRAWVTAFDWRVQTMSHRGPQSALHVTPCRVLPRPTMYRGLLTFHK